MGDCLVSEANEGFDSLTAAVVPEVQLERGSVSMNIGGLLSRTLHRGLLVEILDRALGMVDGDQRHLDRTRSYNVDSICARAPLKF